MQINENLYGIIKAVKAVLFCYICFKEINMCQNSLTMHSLLQILKGIISLVIIIFGIGYFMSKKKIAKIQNAQQGDMTVPKEIYNSDKRDEYLEQQNTRVAQRNNEFSIYLNKMEQFNDWLIWSTILLGIVEVLSTFDFFTYD